MDFGKTCWGQYNTMETMKTSPYSLLIVDDDPDILLNAKHLLSKYQVFTETSPLKALEILKKEKITLILSDFEMPELNGIELFKKSLEIKPSVKRVLVSSFVDLANSDAHWNEAKVHHVLAKPYKPADLIDVVERALISFEIEEENERLRKLSLTDSVTGVSNQRFFWDRLGAELSRSKRFNRPMCLVLFDVDGFKEINDNKGHLEGDAILKQVAELLTREVRQMDIVSRYGGDEFAVILLEIEVATAIEIAKRAREKIFHESGISLSGGVSSFPESATEKELVENADAKLMKVKKASKGQIL